MYMNLFTERWMDSSVNCIISGCSSHWLKMREWRWLLPFCEMLRHFYHYCIISASPLNCEQFASKHWKSVWVYTVYFCWRTVNLYFVTPLFMLGCALRYFLCIWMTSLLVRFKHAVSFIVDTDSLCVYAQEIWVQQIWTPKIFWLDH